MIEREAKRTVLFDFHKDMGARMGVFAGYEMPLNYKTNSFEEHLLTRKKAGLFDISHMGVIEVLGTDAEDFLQKHLTCHVNDSKYLDIGISAYYSALLTPEGTTIDDVFLYDVRKALGEENHYMIVVNASRKQDDFNYLQIQAEKYGGNVKVDRLFEKAGMISVQGPQSLQILEKVLKTNLSPISKRNRIIGIEDVCLEKSGKRIKHKVIAASTGYAGEHDGAEMIFDLDDGLAIIELLKELVEQGAAPVGLVARDSLRLEKILPLYGHEHSLYRNFASSMNLFSFGVRDGPVPFIGKEALQAYEELPDAEKLCGFESSGRISLPREKRIENGSEIIDKIYFKGDVIGQVTSGAWIPKPNDDGTFEKIPMCIGYILRSTNLTKGDEVEIEGGARKPSRKATRTPFVIVKDKHIKPSSLRIPV
jgi:glycine cleavage system T protein